MDRTSGTYAWLYVPTDIREVRSGERVFNGPKKKLKVEVHTRK